MYRLPLLSLLALAACAPSRPAAELPTGPLAPGDRRLAVDSVAVDGTETSTLYLVRDGDRQPFGTLTEEVRLAPEGLVRVQRLASPRGAQVDSLVAFPDLTPRSHYSQNPARTVDLRFDQGSVTGSYTNADAEPVRVRDSLERPAFDSNVIDLVARALPLDAGFAETVRTYERAAADAEVTAVPYTVRVVGQEVVGGRSAYVVEYRKPGGGPTRVYVDAETRRALRREAEVAPGVLLVIEPSQGG